MRRIHYLINARIPHVRAYGIQIAKMCEAIIESGTEVILVVPSTERSRRHTMREENNLRVDVPLVRLWGLDWYDRGRLRMLAGSIVFMLSSFLYLLSERLRGRLEVVYTIDMDTFSYALLPLLRIPIIIELHGAPQSTFVNRFFFRRISLIIPTNLEIRDAVKKRFSLPSEVFFVAANGVDPASYQAAPDRASARSSLGIAVHDHVALYAGRFYPWKGLDILAAGARLAPEISWYVIGGSREDFLKMTNLVELPDNLHIMGDKPEREVPRWLAAADTLLLLGTAKNERSFRFTSPMKLYEYLAAERPIVASSTPALKSAGVEECVFFYTPDDTPSFVAQVREAASGYDERRRAAARTHGAAHTWQRRANDILARMKLCVPEWR